MAVYTELFAEGVVNAVTAIWTCPSDGATYVVRDCYLVCAAGGTNVAVVGTSAGALIQARISTADYEEPPSREQRSVIPNGSVLSLTPFTAVPWSYRLTGYRLV